MVKIVPSIIAKTPEEFEKLIRLVEPYVDRVHLDIMDGQFVSNKTISGYEELIKINTKLKFDIHLMVSNPENQMFNWYKTKADRFYIHAETDHGHRNLLEQIHLNNRQVGLVLNPETRIEKIAELIEFIDFVQFMTVHPGNYGAGFIESAAGKILEFHGQHPDIPIAVDGGVNIETAPRLVAAGARILVVGSYIFKSDNIGKAIDELRNSIK